MLGPALFTHFTTQVGQIIDRYGIGQQHFTDDTQPESSFDTNEASVKGAVENLQERCYSIKPSMTITNLKLNDEKIEAVLCGSQRLVQSVLKDQICTIQVGDASISVSDLVRLAINSSLEMTAHVSSVITACYCHIGPLGKPRPLLTQSSS